MLYSIVIPCYREAEVLRPTCEKLVALMEHNGVAPADYEIIFVIEKSTDDSVEIVRGLSETYPSVVVLENDAQYGKGYSIRRGTLHSRGDQVFLVDADLPLDLEKYFPLMKYILTLGDSDAVYATALGDKTDPKKRGYTRTVTTFSLFTLRRWVLGHNITDSQLGCKLFKGSVIRELMESITEKGFLYELQLLDLLLSRGYQVEECAVRIDKFSEKSTVTKRGIVKNALRFLRYVTVERKRFTKGQPN